MPKFAQNTEVSVDKSRAEIEATLRRYGCREFGYTTAPTSAAIGFRLNALSIKITLPMPDREAEEFTMARVNQSDQKFARRSDVAERIWEQACRQRWRALALVVKAKLEAVECGISTVENEFLAYVVTDTGETVGERMVPRLVEIARGNLPLLPAPGRH